MSLTRTYGEDSWLLSDNCKTILTVQETMKDTEILIGLTGSLRNDTEQFFQDELVALATVGMDIRVDCQKLDYICNSCMNALLSVQQKMDTMQKGGSLTLCNVPESIYAEMKKLNLHELLMIE